jgi:hypothetical protein
MIDASLTPDIVFMYANTTFVTVILLLTAFVKCVDSFQQVVAATLRRPRVVLGVLYTYILCTGVAERVLKWAMKGRSDCISYALCLVSENLAASCIVSISIKCTEQWLRAVQ